MHWVFLQVNQIQVYCLPDMNTNPTALLQHMVTIFYLPMSSFSVKKNIFVILNQVQYFLLIFNFLKIVGKYNGFHY